MGETSTRERERDYKRVERLIRQEEKTQKQLSAQVDRYEKRLGEICQWFCGSTARELHRMAARVEEEVVQNHRMKTTLGQAYGNMNVMKKLQVQMEPGPSLSEDQRRGEIERVLCKLYKTESILAKRVEKVSGMCDQYTEGNENEHLRE